MCERDEHGRFTPGSKPVNGLDKRPQDRNKFPKRTRSFQLAAQKYLDMTDEQIRTALADTEHLSQAEQLALESIARAKAGDLTALALLLDRTEGKAATGEKQHPDYEPPEINIIVTDNHAQDNNGLPSEPPAP